jgi:hypothetical protein
MGLIESPKVQAEFFFLVLRMLLFSKKNIKNKPQNKKNWKIDGFEGQMAAKTGGQLLNDKCAVSFLNMGLKLADFC